MTNNLFDTDSEVAVLSILISDPSKFYDTKGLKDFMFSSIPNRIIYKTISEIIGLGLIPDITLIEHHLNSKNSIIDAGGPDYLRYIIAHQYNSTNFIEYQLSVVDSYKARTLINLSREIPDFIANSGQVDTAINQLKNSLDRLIVNSAIDSTVVLGDEVQGIYDDIVKRAEKPGLTGFTTGFKDVDLITSGVNPGDLWLIAGRPGQGKTASICNMILSQSYRGISNLVFSLEMNRKSFIDRLISIQSGVPLMPNLRTGLLDSEDLENIANTLREFKPLPIYIDTNFSPNLEYIESTIRKYKRLYGINVIYLDYIQLLSERGTDSTNELGRISRKFKLLANDLGVGAVLVSQLNRALEGRDDKRPKLADLRQSGNLEEDGDVVIGLYRESTYDKKAKHRDLMEYIVLKQRNGPTGTIFLSFNENTNKIRDKDG